MKILEASELAAHKTHKIKVINELKLISNFSFEFSIENYSKSSTCFIPKEFHKFSAVIVLIQMPCSCKTYIHMDKKQLIMLEC